MAFRDLIPWNNQGRNIVQRSAYVHPFLALHREMNRMFDDVFRGFDLAPFGFKVPRKIFYPLPQAPSGHSSGNSAVLTSSICSEKRVR